MKRTLVIIVACLSLLLPVQAAWKSGPVFNVIHYGANPDGRADSSRAIANAIDACRLAGGGVVRVPAGTYMTGPVKLVSNLTLQLDAGATLKFLKDYQLYPVISTRYEGTMAYGPTPLVYGQELENVRITGKGTFDGQGKRWWDRHHDSGKVPNVIEGRVKELNKAIAVNTGAGNWKTGFQRPPLFHLNSCNNVLIEGVTFTNSPFWTVHPVFCKDVVIRNLHIKNPPNAPNTDGIDVDSCADVEIHNCLIDVGDDCIVLKSGINEDGRRVGRPTERVHIHDCKMLAGHGGVVIGSDMSGGVRDVLAEDCDFIGTNIGIRLKTERGRGGVVENIRIRDIKMEKVGIAVNLNMLYHELPAEPVSERTPRFRNIEVSDIKARDVRECARMVGLEEMPLENIRFRDFDLSGRVGFICTKAKGLKLEDVTVTCTEGPALRFKDVSDCVITDFASRGAGKDEPIARMINARNMKIENVRIPDNTRVFLQLSGERTAGITLTDLSAKGLAKAVEPAADVPANAVR